MGPEASEVFDLKPTSKRPKLLENSGMATIPELLDGHVTLEVECLDCLYLNGYIGKLATGPGLMMFMRGQLGKPVPSPVVLGLCLRNWRGGEDASASTYRFTSSHKKRKDDIANEFRRKRPVGDGIVRNCLYRGGPREGAGFQREESQRAVSVRPE
jgi:hypothetical protein